MMPIAVSFRRLARYGRSAGCRRSVSHDSPQRKHQGTLYAAWAKGGQTDFALIGTLATVCGPDGPLCLGSGRRKALPPSVLCGPPNCEVDYETPACVLLIPATMTASCASVQPSAQGTPAGRAEPEVAKIRLPTPTAAALPGSEDSPAAATLGLPTPTAVAPRHGWLWTWATWP